jgi:hypothetical protein
MSRTYQIIGLFTLVVGAFVLWNVFVTPETASDSVLGSTTITDDAVGADALKLLLDMRSIKLDARIFESQAFQTLQDTGQEIIPEPVGRTNPFAPSGTDDVTIIR